MKHTKFLLLPCLLLLAFVATAQTDTMTNMIVHKDSRIDLLVKKQSTINKTAVFKTHGGAYKGYRIMVLNTNDRELAYKTRGELLSRFPEHKVYMGYQTPFFKLKMGDFAKREDAEDLRKQLVRMLPKGVFIIQDVVQLKPEDEAKLLKEAEGKE